jgi:hypothetical protein
VSLYNGIDPVAIATVGTYNETYVTSTGGARIANLFASWGLLESAPTTVIPTFIAGLYGKLRARLGLTPY